MKTGERMKKQNFIPILFILVVFTKMLTGQSDSQLPGFTASPYFQEQYVTFNYEPGIRIHINAPGNYDPQKPVRLALYALPNGNTIEQTVGKITGANDDRQYDIQHISAQTRFLREKLSDVNLLTAYLETTQKSWPAWKSETSNHAAIVKKLVEYLKTNYRQKDVRVVLTGHSGGGRFIFSFLDGVNDIPLYIDRICFLDSDYGYEDQYGEKIKDWLVSSEENCLSVIAYNDSVALYNGEPIVSPTGGTWYRSKMMQNYLSDYFEFDTNEDENMINHRALNGRISILLKKNPERKILHTVQVEKNGFIHTLLTGTELENDGYDYYGERAYAHLIQEQELPQSNFQMPLRSWEFRNGDQFMQAIKNLDFTSREEAIYKEFLYGNIPDFYRQLTTIEQVFNDNDGNTHTLAYDVMPDYLAIGCDTNFCRVPMGPITAQRIADFYGCTMPTRKLVDDIYRHAEIKLAPVTYYPVGNNNEKVDKFIEHNTAINQQFSEAGGVLGQLVGGIKKDVIISNKITDPNRDHHVVIYGWHTLDGDAIQPLYNGHIDSYVDYSHGIRLLKSEVLVDREPKTIQQILRDPVLYKLVSDESGIMVQPTYISDDNFPEKPKSFGIKSQDNNAVKILVNPEADVHHLYTSKYGVSFDHYAAFSGTEYLIENLPPDDIFYIKLRAENEAGLSDFSEILAVVPNDTAGSKLLIVNGFDRPSDGNTYNFLLHHGIAAQQAGILFESATNEAITNGLFDLTEYEIVDYILGDESTAEETFSDSEQALVSNYLENGGKLFVSGSEIAWDLDYKGSTSDKKFIHNYLKAKYSADAPGDESGRHYHVSGLDDGPFAGMENIAFDDGTHGTMNIKWPDALAPINGGKSVLQYDNVSNHKIAGITYSGNFGDGEKTGKVVYLGFPLESVYHAPHRNEIMARVIDFFTTSPNPTDNNKPLLPKQFALSQNSPNPFNPFTTINYKVPVKSNVMINIFDLQGKSIKTLVNQLKTPDYYQVVWDATDARGQIVPSGMYLYQMIAKNNTTSFSQTGKMLFLK